MHACSPCCDSPRYALPGDVARADLSPQKAYTDLIRNLMQMYAHALGDAPDGERRAQALALLDAA